MPRGANSPQMGRYNQRVVIDAIRRHPGGLSRVEIAEQTGLSAQTISNVTRRISELGLVRDVGRASSGPGKPRTLLDLAPDGAYAVGVHIDPTHTSLAVLDLSGDVVGSAGHRTPRRGRPERVLSVVTTAIRDLVTRLDLPWDRVAGVGVSTPGPIDATRGVVLNPPLLGAWHDVPVRDELARRLELPVLLEKDVVAACVGEQWLRRGDGGGGNFLYVYMGTGVGCGIVQEGRVLRGATNNIGEVGHLRVSDDGPPCPGCGARGTFGASVSPVRVASTAAASGALTAAVAARLRPDDPESVWAALGDLTTRALHGHATAGRVIGDLSRDIAVAVSTITDLVDLDEVTCGGQYWRQVAPAVLQTLPALLGELPTLSTVRPVRLVASSHPGDVGSIGAAALVLDDQLSPRPDTLLLTR